MTIKPDKFLLPEEDGLPMRESQPYVADKLDALKLYLNMALTATKNKPWLDRYYLDLESGPGKDHLRDSGDILLGSPLIALQTDSKFSKFWFNDIDREISSALTQRVQSSPLFDRVTTTTGDVNEIVFRVCEEIDKRDAESTDGWTTLNIAFLDPKGLELHWKTVERLAQVRRMDLIINFFTSSIRRNYGAGNYEIIDNFFGTQEWRRIYDEVSNRATRRRALIRLYLDRLQQFGYETSTDDELSQKDIPIKNSKNAEVYTLIFASKHPLGEHLWRQAAKSVRPRRLPGF